VGVHPQPSGWCVAGKDGIYQALQAAAKRVQWDGGVEACEVVRLNGVGWQGASGASVVGVDEVNGGRGVGQDPAALRTTCCTGVKHQSNNNNIWCQATKLFSGHGPALTHACVE
jgi:hypothetical protein